MSELYDLIVNEYLESHSSISTIASKLGTNKVKVQRVLITEGLWSSKTSILVGNMRSEGLSVSQIARILDKDEKTIQTYLPYTKGEYGSNSKDSIRSKAYRERQKYVSENMHNKPSSDTLMGYESMEEEIIEEKPVSSASSKTYRLSFELYYDDKWPDNTFDKNLIELRKYAKTNTTIRRVCDVPGNMNLHSMHYMIQQLFGFLNCHLHEFRLMNDEFEQLSEDSLKVWSELVGVLFQFPINDEGLDQCWDDDYKEGQSIKTWYKKKYNTSKPTRALGDNWYFNQIHLQDFLNQVKNGDVVVRDFHTDKIITIDMDSTLTETRSVFLSGFNRLMEGLRVQDLFTLAPIHELHWWDSIYSQEEDNWNEVNTVKRSKLESIQHKCEELIKWRDSLNNVYFAMSYDRESLKERTGFEPEVVLDYHLKNVRKLERVLKQMPWTVQVEPRFKSIIYNYDFGDNWHIKITCIDILDQSISKPVCIEAEGYNLVEDVGGISGFIDFLQSIENNDEEAESNLTWARSLGWNKRIYKPDKIL